MSVVRITWLGNLAWCDTCDEDRTRMCGHVTQLTSTLHQLHDRDAVLVALEHPGAVLHVVDPAPDRQVRAARVERLGRHDDLQDHARVTLKCLTQHF